jgi:predicted O-linked N-acetylglucosamine transferase (SPINDLY family)
LLPIPFHAAGQFQDQDSAIMPPAFPASLRPSGPSAIEIAFAAYRRGDWVAADRMFQEILRATPQHFDALHLLGVLRTGQGQHAEAVRLIKRALKLNPRFADAHYNLGVALQGLGKIRDAVASYREVLALAPNHLHACNNLGIALQAMGRREEAERIFRRAVAIEPAFAEAHHNLGRALAEMERREEAVACYAAALRAKPDYVDALNNMGAALEAMGDYASALEVLTRAVSLAPTMANARNNLAVVLGRLGRHDEAIGHLRTALKASPEFAEAHNNLGNALKALHRYEPAIASYRAALAANADYVEAMVNLGNVLALLSRHSEAVDFYRQALAIRPDFSEAHVCLLFALDFDPAVTAGEHQAERRRWYERHAKRFASSIKPHANDRDPDRKLRIGYVSADFRRHSAAVAFAPAVAHHDLERFDVMLYSNTAVEDDMTDRLRAAASGWRRIRGLSDDALADVIRSDRIDILIDLSGHSEGNRLLMFARKPAPIQVSAWGHVTGTGLPTIDYLFADAVCMPEAHRRWLAEAVYDLPCAIAYDPPEYAPAVAPSPVSLGNPLTFGCLNRLSKVSAHALDLWARLLRDIPDARILLKDVQLSDPEERARIGAAFAERGVGQERLLLFPGTGHAEHLAAYGQVDIALDPIPASGGVSTLEALWMGVPVLALAGTEGSSGRAAATVLTALGLTDWIARTEDDYLGIARRWTEDVPGLGVLRGNLRPHMASTPVGNPDAYSRAVEAAYRAMWASYCAR